MLDTNAFNIALDSGIEPTQLSNQGELYMTHVQLNEIQATRSDDRLKSLLSVFSSVEQEAVPTAAAVFDVSEWGGAEWGDGDGTYTAILNGLNTRNGGNRGNVRDALIAVTALKRNFTLVTNDSDLAEELENVNGSAISFDEFIS